MKKSTGPIYWGQAANEPLAESDLSGNIQREFIFFGGKRVARLDLPAGAVHYYFSDHLGSSNVVTNATGTTIEEESDFYPFGGERVITDLLPDQRYKFTGKERDTESNLDYFGARYYSSNLGRFITPDWAAKPVAVPYANFGNPQSLNLYSYVQNNPTTTGDPDGHCPILALCLAAARYVRNWAAKGIAQEGGKQFAKDAGIGHAKGVGSFAYHAALSSPAGMIAEHLVKEPKALSPTNEVQAGAKNITTGTLVVGSLLVSAALSGPTAAETLANRAQEIHGALDPIAQNMRTTAVADAINADGSTARLVSSSEASLSPAQRAVLSPGETPVSGPGHAEETIMNSAQQNGQTVTTMGVSRTPCQGCAQTLKDAGVDVQGPKE